MAHTVEKIVNFDETNSKQTILYISNTHAFMFFFKSVLSILMLNISSVDSLNIEINPDNSIKFTYNNLSLIYTTSKNATVLSKYKHFTTIVLDLENCSEKERRRILCNKRVKAEKIILTYNSKTNSELPLDILDSIMKLSKNRTSLLDYATGQGFFNIIEASF